MHFPLPALAALTTLALTTTATIAIGTFRGNTIASISGQASCDDTGFTIITSANNNPCGTLFTLENGYTYTLEGCGTDSFAVYNGDGFGSYNAKCEYSYSNDACDCEGPKCGDYLTQLWLC